MRFLYLPIFESGSVHDTQVAQKRGLYNALSRCGEVLEWDYLANDPETRYEGMINRLEQFEPTHILTQLHGSDIFTSEQITEFKYKYLGKTWINWSGDSWNHSLIAPDILQLAHQFDLWLVAAPAVLPVYAKEGINAEYWNIAYEPPLAPLPDMPTFDIVFLANVINDKRKAFMEWLVTLPYTVGIYGDWEHSQGSNVYNFAAGEALYKNAKIAICDNVYEDTQMYISNRPMQAMMAGGALVLHQYVPGMYELSGWRSQKHYVRWHTTEDLDNQLFYWIDSVNNERRLDIVKTARKFTAKHHSFDARVSQLVNEFLPKINKGVK